MSRPCWTVRSTIQQIEALLTEQPMSRVQLAERMQLNKETLRRVMCGIRECIHVARWDKPGKGVVVPIYAWGARADVDRPPAQALVVYQQKQKERRSKKAKAKAKKRSAVVRIVVRKMEIAPPVRAEFRPRRDPMTAMFFGAPS